MEDMQTADDIDHRRITSDANNMNKSNKDKDLNSHIALHQENRETSKMNYDSIQCDVDHDKVNDELGNTITVSCTASNLTSVVTSYNNKLENNSDSVPGLDNSSPALNNETIQLAVHSEKQAIISDFGFDKPSIIIHLNDFKQANVLNDETTSGAGNHSIFNDRKETNVGNGEEGSGDTSILLELDTSEDLSILPSSVTEKDDILDLCTSLTNLKIDKKFELEENNITIKNEPKTSIISNADSDNVISLSTSSLNQEICYEANIKEEVYDEELELGKKQISIENETKTSFISLAERDDVLSLSTSSLNQEVDSLRSIKEEVHDEKLELVMNETSIENEPKTSISSEVENDDVLSSLMDQNSFVRNKEENTCEAGLKYKKHELLIEDETDISSKTSSSSFVENDVPKNTLAANQVTVDEENCEELVSDGNSDFERNNFRHKNGSVTSRNSSFYGHDDRMYWKYYDDVDDDETQSLPGSESDEISIDISVADSTDSSRMDKYSKSNKLRSQVKKIWTSRADVEARWCHDLYVEEDQMPKSTQEIIDTYGYDIRKEKSPPEFQRREKFVTNSNQQPEICHSKDLNQLVSRSQLGIDDIKNDNFISCNNSKKKFSVNSRRDKLLVNIPSETLPSNSVKPIKEFEGRRVHNPDDQGSNFFPQWKSYQNVKKVDNMQITMNQEILKRPHISQDPTEGRGRGRLVTMDVPDRNSRSMDFSRNMYKTTMQDFHNQKPFVSGSNQTKFLGRGRSVAVEGSRNHVPIGNEISHKNGYKCDSRNHQRFGQNQQVLTVGRDRQRKPNFESHLNMMSSENYGIYRSYQGAVSNGAAFGIMQANYRELHPTFSTPDSTASPNPKFNNLQKEWQKVLNELDPSEFEEEEETAPILEDSLVITNRSKRYSTQRKRALPELVFTPSPLKKGTDLHPDSLE